MLLNKESKRETSSVVAFTSKTRFMGTEAGRQGGASGRWGSMVHGTARHSSVAAAEVAGPWRRHHRRAVSPPRAWPPPNATQRNARLQRPPSPTPAGAVSSLTTNPRNTVGQVKRLIGKKFADPAVQRDLLSLPFKVVEAPGGGCHCEVSTRPRGARRPAVSGGSRLLQQHAGWAALAAPKHCPC